MKVGSVSYRIPFIKPSLPPSHKIALDYHGIIKRNWFTNFGPLENRFSSEAASFISKKAVATTISNATLGLDAAISTLFIKEKKYAVIPSFTFAAGVNILIMRGYTPVFIDIDPETWQPDIDQTQAFLAKNKKNTAGILLANTFGVGNQNIREWEKLAATHKLPLVIDSAAGFGSMYTKSEKVGLRGDCELFSLHATKPFSVGEGGLVVSRNKKLIADIRSWQNFGFEADRNIHRIGTNAKFQEINAAIALRQLNGFTKRLRVRRKNLSIYKKRLASIEGISFQANDDLSTVPFVSVSLPSSLLADKAQKQLLDAGVEVRKYYAPLHLQDKLSIYVKKSNKLINTDNLYGRLLSLPLHDGMTLSDIKYVTNVVTKALNSND